MNRALMLRIGEDLAAIALGAAIVWVVRDRYLHRKYMTEAYGEVEALRVKAKKKYQAAQNALDQYKELSRAIMQVEIDNDEGGSAVDSQVMAEAISKENGYVVDDEVLEELMVVTDDGQEENDDPEVTDMGIFENRDTNFPYIATTQEYETTDLDRISITYYEEDDVLADDKENVVEDVQHLIGDALQHFGEGSGDPNVVFVFNESMDAAFEVTRVDGTYSHLVLGFKHSYDDEKQKKRIYKMRRDG